MKKRNSLFLLFLGALMLGGCVQLENADYSVNTSDLDLVATNYDKNFNFKGTTKTYSLPDSVVIIDDASVTGAVKYVKPTNASVILNAISSNMAAYGWTKVAKTASPSVIILPTVFETTNIAYYYSYNYWSWYYPYYGGGYYYYYPYYPSYGGTYSYSTGTLMMQCTDPSDTTTEQLPVRWLGMVNGLMTGSTAEVQVRATTTINQAFKQSPYLKVN